MPSDFSREPLLLLLLPSPAQNVTAPGSLG